MAVLLVPQNTYRFTLGDYFPPLDTKISRQLIGESQLAKIRNYADFIPGQVSAFFGFECPLASGQYAADLLFCSTQLEGHSKILAGQHHAIAMPPEFLELSAWRKVREFCIDWEDPSSPLNQQLLNIWLEFDIAKSEPPYAPNIFFGTLPPEKFASRNEGHLIILEALERLVPEALEGERALTLNNVFKSLPVNAHIFQVGAMLAREVPAIRLCLRDIDRSEIIPTLSNMGWVGAEDELASLIDELDQHSDQIDIDIDVGETIGDKIGLECSFGRNSLTLNRMRSFTNWLVEKKLTSREKAQALMDFNGLVHQDSEPEKWAHFLLKIAAISGRDVANHISCWLHHIKLVHEVNRPLTAKAYLAVAPDRLPRQILRERIAELTP